MRYNAAILLCIIIMPNVQSIDRIASAPRVSHFFHNLPRIETDRLILRKVQPEDLHDLHEINSDPAVVKYVACALDTKIEDTKKWLEWRLNNAKEGRPNPWAVVLKSTNKVIGLAGFCALSEPHGAAELMGLGNRAHWNNGYAREALQKIIEFGFTHMGLNRIDSYTHPEHAKIIALHEKFGFIKVGMIPECKWYRGSFYDRVLFTLLKQKFLDRGEKC